VGGGQFESVPVSLFVKVYNYLDPKNEGSEDKDPDTPTKKSQEYHFRDLHYLEEPYYVVSTGEIFPYDFDQAGGVGAGGEQSSHPRRDRYLRPEFVQAYERPLRADARKEALLGYQVAKEIRAKEDEVSAAMLFYENL
jgi:hypothetical protein